MEARPSHPTAPRNRFWHWFPEFLALGRKRIRMQSRLLGSAMLVGLVTGLAAAVFLVAFQVVEHYALFDAVGYHPPAPAGEPPLPWLPESNQPPRWWLLLVIPAVGGLLSGVIVFTLAPEAEGHGTDSVID